MKEEKSVSEGLLIALGLAALCEQLRDGKGTFDPANEATRKRWPHMMGFYEALMDRFEKELAP